MNWLVRMTGWHQRHRLTRSLDSALDVHGVPIRTSRTLSQQGGQIGEVRGTFWMSIRYKCSYILGGFYRSRTSPAWRSALPQRWKRQFDSVQVRRLARMLIRSQIDRPGCHLHRSINVVNCSRIAVPSLKQANRESAEIGRGARIPLT